MDTIKRSINLKHLFWSIIEKWNLILIISVVCSVAGGGYAILKQKIEDKSLKPEQEVIVSEEEFTGVQSATMAYDMLEAQKKYNQQCIWLKCKDLTKEVSCVVYQIQAETELEINQITALYASVFEDNTIYEKMASLEKEKMEGKYIKEGVTFEIPASGIFQIEVTSYSEEAAQNWMQEVNFYIDSKTDEIEKSIGIKYEIKKVHESSVEQVDSALAELQMGLNRNLDTLQTSYDTIRETLSANQMEYLTLYLQSGERENYIEGQPFIKEEYLENRTSVLFRRLKIDIVLAFFAGICLACLIIVFRYLYSSYLVNREDLEMMYGLTVLGEMSEKKKAGKFNTWIQKKKEKNLHLDIMTECREIVARISVQKSKGSKIYITGTGLNEKCLKLLKEEGEKQGIVFVQGKNFIKNPEALAEIRDYNSVVLLEREYLSKYSEIEKEVKLCTEGSKDIVGVILVE